MEAPGTTRPSPARRGCAARSARLILEQAADAIFLGAPNGAFTGVNERACELTGREVLDGDR
jgi:PAS domain-containing protein